MSSKHTSAFGDDITNSTSKIKDGGISFNMVPIKNPLPNLFHMSTNDFKTTSSAMPASTKASGSQSIGPLFQAESVKIVEKSTKRPEESQAVKNVNKIF